MRLNQLLNEGNRRTPLDRHKRNLAKIAQKIYDEWDEDEDEYAGGGICHIIADAFVDYFSRRYSAFYEPDTMIQHVFVVVVIQKPEDEELGNMDEFYRVDIDPYTYETGGGFSWEKIPGVEFDPRDVDIEFLGRGEDWYYNFDLDPEDI